MNPGLAFSSRKISCHINTTKSRTIECSLLVWVLWDLSVQKPPRTLNNLSISKEDKDTIVGMRFSNYRGSFSNFIKIYLAYLVIFSYLFISKMKCNGKMLQQAISRGPWRHKCHPETIHRCKSGSNWPNKPASLHFWLITSTNIMTKLQGYKQRLQK